MHRVVLCIYIRLLNFKAYLFFRAFSEKLPGGNWAGTSLPIVNMITYRLYESQDLSKRPFLGYTSKGLVAIDVRKPG